MLWKARARFFVQGLGAAALLALTIQTAGGQAPPRDGSAVKSPIMGLNGPPPDSQNAQPFALRSAVLHDEAGPGVINAPYSGVGTLETVAKFPDGNRIVQVTRTLYYRDGQGRTRTETATGDWPTSHVWIIDPVKQERIVLSALSKRATVFPSTLLGAAPRLTVTPPVPVPPPLVHFSTLNVSTPLEPNGTSTETVSLGEKVIDPGQVSLHVGPGNEGRQSDLGDVTVSTQRSPIDSIRVVGTRVGRLIEAHRMGNERPIMVTAEQWFSQDLGVVIQASERSSMGVESTYRLEQIVLGEPDPGLFAIPADYIRQEMDRSKGISIFNGPPGLKSTR